MPRLPNRNSYAVNGNGLRGWPSEQALSDSLKYRRTGMMLDIMPLFHANAGLCRYDNHVAFRAERMVCPSSRDKTRISNDNSGFILFNDDSGFIISKELTEVRHCDILRISQLYLFYGSQNRQQLLHRTFNRTDAP
jgi:hypothetical protein